MKLTDIFKFKKPEQTDTYNIEDQNDNWDTTENALKARDKSYGLLSNVSLLEWALEQTNGGTFMTDTTVSGVPQTGNWQGVMSIGTSGGRGIFIQNGDCAYYIATATSSFANCTWMELANADHSHASVPALTTARTIDGVKFDGSAAISHYGTCSTSGSTTSKTVSLTNFTLVTGARIIVKFTYANTASSPTLNVNSTGAKSIKYRNSAIGSGVLAASGVYEFVYDGTDWELIGEVMKGAASTISASNLTTNRALISNSSGKVAVSAVTSTELGYLDGVTSNIQTQLNNLNTSVNNLNTGGKWMQLSDKQTGLTRVSMPNLSGTTDIMIIANINAAAGSDESSSAVMLQVHFPVLSESLPLISNRLRSGYYQDGESPGNAGMIQFVLNEGTMTIALERARLNGADVAATTTWTVYYKFNSTLV